MHHTSMVKSRRAAPCGFGGRGGGSMDGGVADAAAAGGGGAFRVGKMLADGDLRVVVLALIVDGPRHGYDIRSRP